MTNEKLSFCNCWQNMCFLQSDAKQSCLLHQLVICLVSSWNFHLLWRPILCFWKENVIGRFNEWFLMKDSDDRDRRMAFWPDSWYREYLNRNKLLHVHCTCYYDTKHVLFILMQSASLYRYSLLIMTIRHHFTIVQASAII